MDRLRQVLLLPLRTGTKSQIVRIMLRDSVSAAQLRSEGFRFMGASVIGYWPDMTEEQVDSQPGFFNDCKAWGNWMAEREQHPDELAALEALGLWALTSYTTDGMDDSEVQWVSPDDLAAAASRLRALVLARDSRVTRIIDSYALSANGMDPIPEELVQDLADVAAIAQFARDEEVTRMTLAVSW